MYRIRKAIVDETEYLPDLVDTEIWKDYDTFDCKQSVSVIAELYKALEKRENYFQQNSPTAFGNPDYRYLCGVVHGILLGAGMEEECSGDIIRFRKGKRTVLIVDKIKRSDDYRKSMAENRDLRRTLGL